MRFRSIMAICLLVGAALSLFIAFASSTGYAQIPGSDGPRPPMLTPYPDFTAQPVEPGKTPVSVFPPQKDAPAFAPVSLFGMNLYLTGLERSEAESARLGQMAAQAGVQWSREELSWANIEPQRKGSYNWTPYDNRLASDFNNNINVIGMLLTTPKWSSTNPSAPDWYWYEPANFNDYFDFVRAAVTRWGGRIHTWEIWNEPAVTGTWNCVNGCDRTADYARLLAGAYAAVKSVDPSARVLVGGTYVHFPEGGDPTGGGFDFLDRVIADSGGAINFDALSIHTYMGDRIPESTDPTTIVQNFQYRLDLANGWINEHGGRPAEIWVTEDGRSTCTGCPSQFRWSEDDQASMLTRMYGIAAASPRVVQFDYFQFEDKFNDPTSYYGAMSIVRDDYSTKPAYTSYKVAQSLLDGATFSGQGPQMVPGNNSQQPDTSDWAAFDYRFVRNGTALHMLWRPNSTVTVNYPVETSQVDVVDRDGATVRVSASGGTIPLTIGPRPQYVVSVNCNARFSDVCPDYWAYSYIDYLASRGIISGYADGTFRPANPATRGQLSKMAVVSRGWPLLNPQTPFFSDVPSSNSFYQYIETARARGVVSGYADGTFRPANQVTRGQTARMVVAAFGWAANTNSGPHFTDVPPGSTFYVYVETAVQHGIVSGYADGTFRPGNAVTRAQLSKMLYLAINQ